MLYISYSYNVCSMASELSSEMQSYGYCTVGRSTNAQYRIITGSCMPLTASPVQLNLYTQQTTLHYYQQMTEVRASLKLRFSRFPHRHCVSYKCTYSWNTILQYSSQTKPCLNISWHFPELGCSPPNGLQGHIHRFSE